MKPPGLQSFRLKNFKAVRDSRTIKFTPLTVFIGNNGVGKSSFIEGLEILHAIVTEGLDSATGSWNGFEDIVNKAVPHKLDKKPGTSMRPYYTNPISFDLQGRLENRTDIKYSLEVAQGESRDQIFIKQESLTQRGRNVPSFTFTRNDSGHTNTKYTVDDDSRSIDTTLVDGTSLLNLSASGFPYDIPLRNFIANWQFLSLVPQNMGNPVRQSRAGSQIRLEKDGSNIAEYLLSIQRMNPRTFEGIVSTLQYILPYSQDLQVALTSELERNVYLQLTESDFKVPGWLLSTGTLRIVALLALLRHPEPPPLIIIEEIENGLDPISVDLIVNEIREAVEDGRTQIILTTHSPYLLNRLLLSDIILVERVEGQPTFTRPGDQETLQQWAERFGPGDLYRMEKLSREGQV
jgi:predicted ATPase